MNISNESNEILKFWFPNFQYQKWWFISTTKLDQQIYDKFYNQMVELFENFNIDYYNNTNPIKLITDIILLDQFSRNIFRINDRINIQAYTQKAELLSNIWIKSKYYLKEPIAYTVFAFLPIRHTKDKNKIANLLPLLEKIKPNKPNKIYTKFLVHTMRALEVDT